MGGCALATPAAVTLRTDAKLPPPRPGQGRALQLLGRPDFCPADIPSVGNLPFPPAWETVAGGSAARGCMPLDVRRSWMQTTGGSAAIGCRLQMAPPLEEAGKDADAGEAPDPEITSTLLLGPPAKSNSRRVNPGSITTPVLGPLRSVVSARIPATPRASARASAAGSSVGSPPPTSPCGYKDSDVYLPPLAHGATLVWGPSNSYVEPMWVICASHGVFGMPLEFAQVRALEFRVSTWRRQRQESAGAGSVATWEFDSTSAGPESPRSGMRPGNDGPEWAQDWSGDGTRIYPTGV
eukprot:gene19304-biopygen19036